MKKLKIVQYGCGKMSVFTMRYVYEKLGEIVGAFDIDKSKIGKDISSVMGGEDKGVLISDILLFRSFLKKKKPDCVIITTMSLLHDCADALLACAECGVNAITTCEEAFYPQNSNPVLFKKIDKLAKANDCTICGSGYQDIFWGNLITTLTGATHSIKKISGQSSYNVEDYGIALARAHGAGLSVQEFEQQIAKADNISEHERANLIKKGEFLPSYMWNVNGWLASQLNYTIISQTQRCVPEIAKSKIHSTTLELDIPKGFATGMSAVVTSTTKEGVIIESKCIGKVYDKTEFDCNQWKVEGEPTTEVIINRPNTVELTCATVVNRIPQIICAPSGYYTTEKLERAHYQKLK